MSNKSDSTFDNHTFCLGVPDTAWDSKAMDNYRFQWFIIFDILCLEMILYLYLYFQENCFK